MGRTERAVVLVAAEVRRVSKKKRGVKRTKWWNEDVQKAVAAKKVAYRKILEVETAKSRKSYIEAKRESKRVVRRAKNEEWCNFGRESEEIEMDEVERELRKMKCEKSPGGE